MFDRYTPHPIHIVIPVALILIAAAVVGIFPSWATGLAFFAVLAIGIATGLWIAWAGKIREETAYWDSVGYDIHQLKHSEPAIWGALGFREPPPNVVHIRDEVTGDEGESDIYALKQYIITNVSPWKIQKFADDILTGRRTLAETQWTGVVPQQDVREIKKQMKKLEMIADANPLNPNAGLVLTSKGEKFLLNYASEGVRSNPELRVFKKQGHTPTPLGQEQP